MTSHGSRQLARGRLGRRLACLAIAATAGCGGGGGSTPTAPTTSAPAAPTAAAFSVAVTVGSRPARVAELDASGPLDDVRVRGTVQIDIVLSERNGVAGDVLKIVLTFKFKNGATVVETLDESALRPIAPGGSLRVPGGGSLTIPYTPTFQFGRSDEITVEAGGEFRDTNGNQSGATSAATPVPLDRIATCRASANHLCLTGQRFQVDAFINGERVTTISRVSDTEGAFEFGAARLVISVVSDCLIRNSYTVRVVAATAAAFAYTVYVTDTLVSSTKTYTNPAGTVPPAVEDLTAFSTCP